MRIQCKKLNILESEHENQRNYHKVHLFGFQMKITNKDGIF